MANHKRAETGLFDHLASDVVSVPRQCASQVYTVTLALTDRAFAVSPRDEQPRSPFVANVRRKIAAYRRFAAASRPS